MSLSILTNSSAMQTQISLNNSSDAVSTAMQRLSSGLRINSAADDAAGYAISQGLTSQVNGLQQASQNVSDATSMVQTADSALNNVQSMLQRVSELAVQYQNGDLSTSDKSDIQGEVNQLTQEIDRQQRRRAVQRHQPARRLGRHRRRGDLPGRPVVQRHPVGVLPEHRELVEPRHQRLQLEPGLHWRHRVRPEPGRRGERHQHGDQQHLVARGERWVRSRTVSSTPRRRSRRRRRTCPRR